MEKPRIMVVCGFGLGSSMVLKLTLDGVLREAGLQADTFCSDETQAKGEKYDMVFTSQQMSKLFQGINKPVVIITNFLSKDEVREKGLDTVKGLYDK